MTPPTYLLGIDLGTSTAKAALFTPRGEMADIEVEEYLTLPTGSSFEVDPDIYWKAIAKCVANLLSRMEETPDSIAAVSTSTFGESVFFLTADGTSSRPSISWMDQRSASQAAALLKEVGPEKVLNLSGQPEVNAIWPATKIRWLAECDPESFRRTKRFLLPDDYVLFRLSGEYVAEQTMWGSSLLMDISRKEWSLPLLQYAGIGTDRLPPLTASGTVVGHVSQRCSDETGLSTSTVVVAGAMDQMCAAVGVGNIKPGIVTESTGTVLALLATTEAPVFDMASRVPCHIHAVPNAYCLLPWSPVGGLLLKWFKDRFAQPECDRAVREGIDPYDVLTAEAAGIKPGCGGLIMLPHLEGALFPEFNPQARGVFFGVALEHTKAHFTRAILESVAYMIRSDLEALGKLGVSVEEIRVLGGGAKSALWSQIKADVCNIDVVVPKSGQAGVRGAAIIAAVGAGLFPDFPTAVDAMADCGARIHPNPSNRSIYQTGYQCYLSLYRATEGLFGSFGQGSHEEMVD
jgi:xylulokinase